MAMICLLKIALLLHPFVKNAKEWATHEGVQGKSLRAWSNVTVGKPAEIQLAAIAAADWEDVL
jgi:hypothetical protein